MGSYLIVGSNVIAAITQLTRITAWPRSYRPIPMVRGCNDASYERPGNQSRAP